MATRPSAILAACLLVATVRESHADDNRYLRKMGGTLVEMKDLPGVERPQSASPLARLAEATTAELPRRERPDPDRSLPAGVRVTTRCRDTWCADGLLVGKKTLIAPEPPAGARGWLRKGWLERVVRVVWQDEKRVSVHVAESWFEDGIAHVNNTLQCRTFDLRSGRALALADVLPGGAADRALAQARRQLASDEGELAGVKSFKTTKEGFRLRGEAGGDGPPDVVVCAQGPYPSESGAIVEMKVRLSDGAAPGPASPPPAAAAGSTRR